MSKGCYFYSLYLSVDTKILTFVPGLLEVHKKE